MAGSQNDPASLMQVLTRHGRLVQAAELALRYLSAWQMQVRKLHLISIGRHEPLPTLVHLCHTLEHINICASSDRRWGKGFGCAWLCCLRLRPERAVICRCWTLRGRSMQLCGSRIICWTTLWCVWKQACQPRLQQQEWESGSERRSGNTDRLLRSRALGFSSTA